MNEIFLDASYAIALSSATDVHHAKAVELAKRLEDEQARLVTTRAVILEIGNALARQRFRPAAVALLESIENDPQIEILPLSEELFVGTLELFRNRLDKEWGLTDCLSFLVMEARELSDALTADRHFQQAGFRALLLEP
jgi:hypothetical protein